jgi:hypothetical protein
MAILRKYKGFVPQGKTAFTEKSFFRVRGGKCPRACGQCEAFQTECQGCPGFCPFAYCPGERERCLMCSRLCARTPQRQQLLDEMGGLSIGKLSSFPDQNFSCLSEFIPAMNKPFKKQYNGEAVSIPFSSLYDLDRQEMIVTDIRKQFHVSDDTQILVNFYMKDDKIFRVFDLIRDGTFWDICQSIQAEWFFSVNASIYQESSMFDQLLNFKRQFWIGDIMRQHELQTFQEIEWMERSLPIIQTAHLRNFAINVQLENRSEQASPQFFEFLEMIRQLPSQSSCIFTGYEEKRFESIKPLSLQSRRLFYSNYRCSYHQ